MIHRTYSALLAAALAVCARAAAAEPLPRLPILRIDTGHHTAFIHALALDESAGRVYSASEDKTVRVWRIADGRLLETFRVPVGVRAEGQLYALALSPDRRVLAVGGWTCWDTEGSACVYLLDVTNGALIGRIQGLPEVVAALRFAPDGRHLAIGMMGRAGLRVYRLADRALIASDTAYHDKLLELDFAPNGRLAAAGLDGYVRLYSERFALLGRVNAGLAGRQPFGLRCSPDGQFVAVGFNDVARVSLLSTRDLRLVHTLQVDGPSLPRNLTRVAWAPDSSALYATGEPRDSGSALVFRWRVAGSDQADRAIVTQGRIGDLVVTRDQFVLFGSDEPSLGLLDPQGKIRYRWLSGIPDYTLASGFRVSRDGSEIEIAAGAQPSERRRFSILHATLAHVSAPSLDLDPPIATAARWKIARWGKSDGPLVNGRRIALEPYEEAHALAISPAASTLVIGTEWALRAVGQSGAMKWSMRTPTAVRTVSTSGDGRFALAVLADGTINWYAMTDGTLMLSLFLHADGENWVAWAPSGYYASSAYGDTLVGWQINRGPDQAPDFFRAVQFERELYRPDLVSARWAGSAARSVADSANDSANDGRHLLEVAPPRVAVSILDESASIRPGLTRIRVTGESTGLPMHDVAVYVNEIPITPARERLLQTAETTRFVRDLDVPLEQAENSLRIEVFNGRSLGVTEKFVIGPSASVSAGNGDLYILAVGANVFPALDRSLNLSFAASDAREFADALLGHAHQFHKVHLQTLSDGGVLPVRAAVLAALEQLKQATGQDTVVVFLASHGVSDAAGNYFFVPRDAQRADIDTILDGKPLPTDSSLIGWLSFFDALRNTAGRRLLIVDTCQAHDISGHVQEYSLLKRSASSRIAFILASKADEESQEYTPGRHGLFTYALLEGLRGAADADRDGTTTVAEWFQFAAGVVDRLRDRRIGPQTPQFIAPVVLQNMEIARAPTGMSAAAGK
jgi:WD40 repeat protein